MLEMPNPNDPAPEPQPPRPSPSEPSTIPPAREPNWEPGGESPPGPMIDPMPDPVKVELKQVETAFVVMAGRVRWQRLQKIAAQE